MTSHLHLVPFDDPMTRHALAVRITLRGIDPPVERTLAMDAGLTLADLHAALQIAFDGSPDTHHVFCDEDPFPDGFPATASDEEPHWYRRRGMWQPLRRWGDDWTKIDWRDPNIIDERTERLRTAFSGGTALHYRSGDPHASGEYAWFRLDAVGDDVHVDGREVRVISGQHRSPLSLVSVRDYAEQLRAYANPRHPGHESARARLDRATGPWVAFDPTDLDSEVLQLRLAAHRLGVRDKRTVLDALVTALPASNAVGLRRHIMTAGLELPAVVTSADAATLAEPFGWLVRRCRAGVELVERDITPEFAQEWADAVGIDVERIPRLLQGAIELRFVRRFKGRLVTLKSLEVSPDNSIAVWNQLARKLFSGDYALRWDEVLFTLAIADGSIETAEGLARIARAQDVLATQSRSERWDGFSPREEFEYEDTSDQPAHTVEGLGHAVMRLAEKLEPLGLAERPDGTWSAPPLLREFARAALNTPAPMRYSYASSGYGPH